MKISKLFILYLMNVAILLIGVLSTVVLKDCTGLVLCGFLFVVTSSELNSELCEIESYIEELEASEYE